MLFHMASTESFQKGYVDSSIERPSHWPKMAAVVYHVDITHPTKRVYHLPAMQIVINPINVDPIGLVFRVILSSC